MHSQVAIWGSNSSLRASPCFVFDNNYVGIQKCEAEYNLDTCTIRRLDTGALLSKEANDAWVRECRRKGARLAVTTRLVRHRSPKCRLLFVRRARQIGQP